MPGDEALLIFESNQMQTLFKNAFQREELQKMTMRDICKWLHAEDSGRHMFPTLRKLHKIVLCVLHLLQLLQKGTFQDSNSQRIT